MELSPLKVLGRSLQPLVELLGVLLQLYLPRPPLLVPNSDLRLTPPLPRAPVVPVGSKNMYFYSLRASGEIKNAKVFWLIQITDAFLDFLMLV